MLLQYTTTHIGTIYSTHATEKPKAAAGHVAQSKSSTGEGVKAKTMPAMVDRTGMKREAKEANNALIHTHTRDHTGSHTCTRPLAATTPHITA